MSNAINIAEEFLRTSTITATDESILQAQVLIETTRELFTLDEFGSVYDLYFKIIDEFRRSTSANKEKENAFVCYLFDNFPRETVFKWLDFY